MSRSFHFLVFTTTAHSFPTGQWLSGGVLMVLCDDLGLISLSDWLEKGFTNAQSFGITKMQFEREAESYRGSDRYTHPHKCTPEWTTVDNREQHLQASEGIRAKRMIYFYIFWLYIYTIDESMILMSTNFSRSCVILQQYFDGEFFFEPMTHCSRGRRFRRGLRNLLPGVVSDLWRARQ